MLNLCLGCMKAEIAKGISVKYYITSAVNGCGLNHFNFLFFNFSFLSVLCFSFIFFCPILSSISFFLHLTPAFKLCKCFCFSFLKWDHETFTIFRTNFRTTGNRNFGWKLSYFPSIGRLDKSDKKNFKTKEFSYLFEDSNWFFLKQFP